ncbi:MAG: uncharacterized protein K0R02_1193 [Rickettsiaceae bacterium]|nr:uncharacterized protein [Rickettsiaceae bacterium]
MTINNTDNNNNNNANDLNIHRTQSTQPNQIKYTAQDSEKQKLLDIITSGSEKDIYDLIDQNLEKLEERFIVDINKSGSSFTDEFNIIHILAFEGKDRGLTYAFSKNANLDLKLITKLGNTALTLAAYKGCNAVVELLLQKGAEVNHVNSNGDTALTIAAFNGHYAVVELLLQKGLHLMDIML